MDPFKYREVRGTFLASVGDSPDPDLTPDSIPLNGSVELTPKYDSGAISFTDLGVLVSPQPIVAAIVGGELKAVAYTPEGQVTHQALHLPVTVDERADQTWYWVASFPEVSIGDTGERVQIASRKLAIEDGEGPVDLTAIASLRVSGAIVTRGARGAGITDITATDGVVTVEWDGGEDVTIPIPTAALATRTSDGLMSSKTVAEVDPIEVGEPGLFRVVDAAGSVALEVDAQGRTHIYAPAAESDVSTLHVFVAAGQSNMSGRGQPVVAPTSPRIMQFGANRRVIEQAPVILDMVDTPSGTSPASFFAHHYLASQPAHVGVLLIPAARGATAFVGTPDDPAPAWTWTPGAAPSPEYALYERSVEQTQEAIVAAEAEGYHVILKGVLWHQGEGNGSITNYAERFDPVVAAYRADLGHPTLPFMVGQMCPEGMEAAPGKYNVDAAHQDTPYRVPFTGFAPATWNGHNEGDTTHFSTVGTAHLGDTYLTAYMQAVGNTRALTGAP